MDASVDEPHPNKLKSICTLAVKLEHIFLIIVSRFGFLLLGAEILEHNASKQGNNFKFLL